MKNYPITHEEIVKWGRYSSRGKSIFLYWTGSGFETDTDSSFMMLEGYNIYEKYENWISVYINGVLSQRFMLPEGRFRVCLFRGLTRGIRRNVRVAKDNQPFMDDKSACLQLDLIEVDDGICKPAEHRFTMEVIGDSITSGTGLFCSSREIDYVPAYHSANNYVSMISDALDIRYSSLAIGGWGVYCGWNNDIHMNMPSLYEQVCGAMDDEANIRRGSMDKWDFAQKNDLILISLGTNDTNAFFHEGYRDPETDRCYRLESYGGKPSQGGLNILKKAAYDFLGVIRERNSGSRILWLYGAMYDDALSAFKEAVESFRITNSDDEVCFVELPSVMDSLGAFGHPDMHGHRKIADAVIDRLKELI